jgi:hypothetical protein
MSANIVHPKGAGAMLATSTTFSPARGPVDDGKTA